MTEDLKVINVGIREKLQCDSDKYISDCILYM